MKQKLKILSLLLGSLFWKQTFAQNNTTERLTLEAITADTTPDDAEIITFTETMPEFLNGGTEGMLKFLNANIKYPTKAFEKNIQGKVIVQFIIDEKGNVKKVAIAKSVRKDLDNEAKRVIKLLDKKWIPGKQNDKPVPVKMTIPITFSITEQQKLNNQ